VGVGGGGVEGGGGEGGDWLSVEGRGTDAGPMRYSHCVQHELPAHMLVTTGETK
jgi:hypothetical protein